MKVKYGNESIRISDKIKNVKTFEKKLGQMKNYECDIICAIILHSIFINLSRIKIEVVAV
ncbi:hypothetical protein K8354_13155 [Polaribacter litorisediminis]|uniref:hypothetical protein n=1 Tax=Polaribacter litorisediminis TaxID=1908341 RepID=UPI001CBF2C01|nr:hypothetical protein [Polaribacter litorisediminis]UAM97261.1 hypothetical protein K8354_13155 [Polaribacter litorisediminis]